MPGVSFKLKALGSERDDSVKNPELLAISVLAHATAVLDFKVLGKFGLVPIEILLKSQSGKVVSMDDYGDSTVRVVEATRRCAP